MEIKVNDANFQEEVLKADKPVLVDFWAEWCGPCRMVGPLIKNIAQKYQGRLKVCKVNVDEAPNSSAQYGVMSIPTLAIFKDGRMVDNLVGAAPEEMIDSKVSKHI